MQYLDIALAAASTYAMLSETCMCAHCALGQGASNTTCLIM